MYLLLPHQAEVIGKLKSGSVLSGRVGSGKSFVALYFYRKHFFDKDLFIITTAKKRDEHDWERELIHADINRSSTKVTIDSWNNIKKYSNVRAAFFIFDEQRAIGSGIWSRSFLKIARARQNDWLMLTGTPGDTWMDYVPIFIASGFYRNRTEFIRKHVRYKPYRKYPVIDRYINVETLEKYRNQVLVKMRYSSNREKQHIVIPVDYDVDLYRHTLKYRWDPFNNRPISDIQNLTFTLRKIVNTHKTRIAALNSLLETHKRIIVFYNFNYERDILLSGLTDVVVHEYSGHKHQDVPNGDRWIYIVQYTAGAEAWQTAKTDTMLFYSSSYSYRVMTQAAGRIDRLNTPYDILFYYHLESKASIDIAIRKALSKKRDFNRRNFVEKIT